LDPDSHVDWDFSMEERHNNLFDKADILEDLWLVQVLLQKGRDLFKAFLVVHDHQLYRLEDEFN